MYGVARHDTRSDANRYRSTAIRLTGNTQQVVYRNKRDKEHLMLDVVMLALGLGFFVLAVGYTYACERL